MSKLTRIAIDGNEANVKNRVGSNVYAFEILHKLWYLTKNSSLFDCTILLAHAPINELPPARKNWRYQLVKPAKLWTQWALPWHLFINQKKYDVFYAPGHYAPRISIVPYVSSVMDVAFLKFPEQFRKSDLYQLKNWTRYSVKRAAKVVTISQFSKQQLHEAYGKPLADIIVAPPAVSLPKAVSPLRAKAFFRKHNIQPDNFVLYLGTLQPRKNITTLIEAFEIFSRFHAANQLKRKTNLESAENPPQLVLAGKIGWLAQAITERISSSPIKEQIIVTGFIGNDLRRPLYQNARATVLIGQHEGFGLPPLESLSVGTIPVVANDSSLPEAVGSAGFLVDPTKPQAIAEALREAWNIPESQYWRFAKQARKQVAKFSWTQTSKTILITLLRVAHHGKKR
jgi:glycosyltransferase involved in cell wall biosynthesis